MERWEELDVIDWQTIEHILDRPNCSRLQKFKLQFYSFPRTGQAKDFELLAKRLPALAARGILVCETLSIVSTKQIDVSRELQR